MKMQHFLEGPDKGRKTKRWKEKKKAKQTAGFEPMSSISLLHCSMVVLQPLPQKQLPKNERAALFLDQRLRLGNFWKAPWQKPDKKFHV